MEKPATEAREPGAVPGPGPAPFELGLVRSAPLGLAAAGFAAGLLLRDLGFLPLPAAAALLAAATAAFAMALRRKAEAPAWAAATAILLALGALRGTAGGTRPAPVLPHAKTVITGTVMSVPVIDAEAGTTAFLLHGRVPGASGSGEAGLALRTTLHWRDDGLRYGDTVRVTGKALTPRPPTNPGQSDLGASFSRRGIDATLSTWDPGGFAVTGRNGGSRVRRYLLAVRAWAEGRLDALVGRPESDLLASIVFGFRAGFPPEIIDAFQTTGLMHILVASGLNVGLLAWLALRLFSLLRVPPARASLMTIPLLIAYLALCGGDTPLLRSTLMFCILVAARAAGRAPAAVNALGLTALLVLAVDPGSLYDRSFLLSFVATLGVLVLVPWLAARMAFLPGLVAEAAACTLSAQLFLFPLLAAMFMSVPLLGVLANLLVTPAMGVMLAGGLALLAFGWIPFAGAAVGGAMKLALMAALKVVTAFSSLPLASVVVPPLSPAGTLFWFLWGGGALMWMADSLPSAEDPEGPPPGRRTSPPGPRTAPRAWPRVATLAGAAGLALLAWKAALAPAPGNLSVTFLDVGQGLSVAVQLPSGHTVLYDAGPPFAGGSVVVPYLRHSGTGRLPAFVLSHSHSDHAGGAAVVARRLVVDMAVVPLRLSTSPSGAEGGGTALRLLLEAAGRRGVPLRYAASGDRLEGEPGVRISFAGPPRAAPVHAAKADTEDENGLVMLVEYGSTALLLPADIRARGETSVAGRLDGVAGRLDGVAGALLLQAPHHGSAKGSSRRFLARLDPKMAVVCCGRDNPFGHPHPATLLRYLEQGTRLHRTDLEGAVTVVSDGKSWRGGTPGR